MTEKKVCGFTVERAPDIKSEKSGEYVQFAHIVISDEFGEVLENDLPSESSDLHILCWISGYVAGRQKAIEIARAAAEGVVGMVDEVERRVWAAERAGKG